MKIEGNSFQNSGGVENTPVRVSHSTAEVGTSAQPAPIQTQESMVTGTQAPQKVGPTDESYIEFARKPRQELSMNESDWIKLIERANKALNGANKSFEYSIHEATKQIMVKVIDKDTKEVIREIPSEKVLDMVAKMWEMSGLFVDERR